MKNCSEIRENISLYIDNELTADERSVFEEHIGVCADCSREYDEVMRIVGLCRNVQEAELPENFRDELHSKLLIAASENITKSSIFKQARYIKIFSSIAAGFLLIFLVSGIYRFGFTHTKTGNNSDSISMKSALAAEPELPRNSGSSAAPAADGGFGSASQFTIAGDVAVQQAPEAATAPAADRSAASDNRAAQAPMIASVTTEEAASSRTISLTVLVDDPAIQTESIKAIALQYGGEEQKKTLLKSESVTAMVTADQNNETILTFSIPNKQYDSFAQSLNKDYGQTNIEPGALVSEDLTAALNSLITRSNDLDTNIKKLEETDATANADKIKEYKTQKDAIQGEIESIRLNTDFTTVTVIIRKK